MSTQKRGDLTLAVGPEGKTRTFGNIEKVREFIVSEQERWAWFDHKKVPAINRVSAGLAQMYLGRFNGMQSHATQYAQAADASNLANLKAQFEATYVKDRVLYSGSPEGKFILHLKDDDIFVAAGALAYLSQKPDPEQRNGLAGSYMAFLFDKGLLGKTTIDPYRESWEEISARFSNSASEVEAVVQFILRDSKNNENQHRERIIEMDGRFKKFMSDAEDERAGLAEAYDKHMSLQAPVDYWETQRTESDKQARYYWKIFVSALIGGVALFVWLVNMWFEGAETDPAAEVSIASWAQQIPLWRIAVVFIATSMWVWILRLLARNLLSHIHIASTAGERVVMTKAYLALLRDKNVDKEHIEIILRNLFRPIATGIVKDDASPTFMVDLIEKATKKV